MTRRIFCARIAGVLVRNKAGMFFNKINAITEKSSLALRLALFFAFVAMMVALAPRNASAQATSACDPEYMDALEARAWMEAQREIAQNQNLIAKPDSVLEYTCFGNFLGDLADDAKRLFSETTFWGSIPPQVSGSMQTALTDLVGAALSNYLTNNFSHPYVNDRLGVSDGFPSGVGTLGNYTCSEMAKVWNAAHCLHFQNQPDYDGFYTFDWYTSSEPRGRSITGINACTVPTRFAQDFNIAYNSETAPYEVDNANDTAVYKFDKVETFLDRLEPGDCTDPIKTGVVVQRLNFTPASYDDYVCSNPGCHFNPDGNKCEK